jgi:hypothetical protein
MGCHYVNDLICDEMNSSSSNISKFTKPVSVLVSLKTCRFNNCLFESGLQTEYNSFRSYSLKKAYYEHHFCTTWKYYLQVTHYQKDEQIMIEFGLNFTPAYPCCLSDELSLLRGPLPPTNGGASAPSGFYPEWLVY